MTCFRFSAMLCALAVHVAVNGTGIALPCCS